MPVLREVTIGGSGVRSWQIRGIAWSLARRVFMAGRVLKILILAGRLGRYDRARRWHHGWTVWSVAIVELQVLCPSKGIILSGDPRVFEFPALGNPWLKGFAAALDLG